MLKKLSSIPKLRFSAFNQEWNTTTISERGRTIGGGTPATKDSENWNGDIPWISSSDLNEESIYRFNISRYITRKAISESATKIVPPKSILIVSRVGVGKVAVNENELCTSQDFTSFIPDKDNYIFLAYLIKLKTNQLLEFNQGTSIKGFVKSDFDSLQINIPTLPEQQKIASFLTSVDIKIEQLTKKKTLLGQYKKGVMQKIFNQEIRFKDENGKGFPEWEEKKLGEVSDCLDNKRKPLNQAERQDKKGEYPYWGANNIMDYLDDYIFDEPIVLLAEDGGNFNEFSTRPIANYYEGKCWVNNHTHVLTGKKSILDSKFLYFSLVHKDITGFVSGGTRSKLIKSEMLKIEIGLPAFAEQTKIANFLSALDTKINHTNTLLEKTKLWKKGLLQQLFV